MEVFSLIGYIAVIFAAALGFALMVALAIVGVICTHHVLLTGGTETLRDIKMGARIGDTVRGLEIER